MTSGPDRDARRISVPPKAETWAKIAAHKAKIAAAAAAAEAAVAAATAEAAARPAAGDPSTVEISGETALLHWCDADHDNSVIDGGPVRVGKRVRMRADWLAGYSAPDKFTVHEETLLIRRILKNLRTERHPMPGFVTEPVTDKITQSRDTWQASVSKVARQSRYYFEDHRQQASGLLTVTSKDYAVTETGVMLNGVKVFWLPFGLGLSFEGAIGRKKTTHRVIAAKDPRLQVEVLTPGQKGNGSLLNHVRKMVEEVLELRRHDNQGDEPNSRPELTDAQLIEASEGYLNPAQHVQVELSDDSHEITVDEQRPAIINVEIQPPGAADMPFRTAYALRLSNADVEDDFVISGIVLIDGDKDSIRVRG